MTLFKDIGKAFDEGCRRYEALMKDGREKCFYTAEIYGGRTCDGRDVSDAVSCANTIACGDNLRYMAELLKYRGLAGRFQLIYADPPFFSNSRYEASFRLRSDRLGASELIKTGAYDDRNRGGIGQYIEMLTPRLLMMKELLAETGCLWVHLDWHAVHCVKMVLDEIFGAENFVNEIIWTYKSGGSGKRRFARKHDTLLVYTKGSGYKFRPLKEKSYNRGLKPYRFKGVEEFEDENGWYTMVNMKDVWNIDMVGRTSSERNGYATQKPEKLLQRIVRSCSDEGDLCADFFAGSGTLGAVCEKLGRSWMMCDASRLAAASQIERMGKLKARFAVERQENEIKRDREDAEGNSVSARADGCRVELTGYRPDIDEALSAAGVDSKAYPEIERYMAEDPLSFVRCWSVDFDYDGLVHRADATAADGCRIAVPGRPCGSAKAGRDISIVGYDMLGNRFEKVIKSD